MAHRIGGAVLELGCGTGRVLLPIAEEGIAIDGVDSSPAMLTQLQRNSRTNPNVFANSNFFA